MDVDRTAALQRAAQNRSLRGMILLLLARSVGRPTMTRIVEQAVLSAGGAMSDTDDLVFYLESKGYVARRTPEEHKVPGIGDTLVITAAGIDLVEGTTEDAGVTF
ncbi:MAG: hypothetical protein ACOY94_19660 [Bacillota bacterium]